MYLICMHLIVIFSHVADGIIPFKVKDWSRMFAQLLLHFFNEILIKPNQTYCQGYLQATLRGQKARPLVYCNVSLTNTWCKFSHCCRSLAHVWMSLDRFGQAGELFLHCCSPWLCMTYASPSGTDESAWGKQWCNLRPSTTVWTWQVTWKTGNSFRLYWKFYI